MPVHMAWSVYVQFFMPEFFHLMQPSLRSQILVHVFYFQMVQIFCHVFEELYAVYCLIWLGMFMWVPILMPGYFSFK